MKIELNGAVHEIADDTMLTALIESVVGSSRGTAAVIDGEVVPRSQWPALALREGQRIELITAVQGG